MENWEQNGNKNCTNHWWSVFFSGVVCCIKTLVSSGTGFMTRGLPLLLHCALWLLMWLTIVFMWQAMLQCYNLRSVVHMWEGLGTGLVTIWPCMRCSHWKQRNLEESEKASSCRELNPGHLWLEPSVSHNSQTTTNPHNPLCTAQVVLNASVSHLAATQYVPSELR